MFFSPSDPMDYTLSLTVCKLQVLPTEQATPVQTDFFAGLRPPHSRLQGQASNDSWTDFFECHHHHRTVSSDGVFFLLDFVQKLRQGASAFRSPFVDADTPVSVLHSTKTILDSAIDACVE